MSSDIKVGESSFVSAVSAVLKVQAEMLALRERLQQLDAMAERANDAALRELGFNEATPFEDIITTQERFLRLAAVKSGLGLDHAVVQAALAQIEEMRDQFEQYLEHEAAGLGHIQGPQL